MVGYRVGNTLSDSGSVARGVCSTDAEGFLTSVVERTSIIRDADGQVKYIDENGNPVSIAENTPVSMNMWGFTTEYFRYSDEQFVEFLLKNTENPKAEFYIPSVVNQLIVNNLIKVKVLDTPSKWFGVTYIDDRPSVVAKIQALVNQGEYPKKLF
jgi:hypothetical protein